MKRLSCVVLLISFVVPSVFALPRFALITGARCGSCHVNPTGGQMRNDYGITTSLQYIPLKKLPWSSSMAPAESTATDTAAGDTSGQDSARSTASGGEESTFNPKLTENISIGGDFRGQFIYDNGLKKTTFQAMNLWLYGAIQLGKKVTLYFKQDVINPDFATVQYGGPEVYSIIKLVPSLYFKGGLMLPDYGWRIDDHTAYTRGGDIGFVKSFGRGHNGLFFVPNYKDIGAEAGWYHGGLFLTAGLFNGTGNSAPIYFSDQKAFTGKAEYMGDLTQSAHYRIGGSAYGFSNYHMYGVHAGVGLEDLAVYGEMDWTRNALDPFVSGVTTGVQEMTGFAEVDYRIVQGAWVTGRFDYFDPQLGYADDPNKNIDLNNSLKRVVLGVEVFPYPFVEFRPQYRRSYEVSSGSTDQLLLQFHYWF